MESHNRPLSPHLHVYKFPLTGVISITHRMTGTVLAIGLLFFVYSLCSIAVGAESYHDLQNLVDNAFFSFIAILFIYALFFHFCHGIRHLIWDAGATFDKATMDKYAIIELVASLVLTFFSLIYI